MLSAGQIINQPSGHLHHLLVQADHPLAVEAATAVAEADLQDHKLYSQIQ